MILLLMKIRITVLLYLIITILIFIGCVTTPPPAPVPELKLEPTVTSNTKKLKVHFIDVDDGDSVLIDLGETEILIDGGLPMSGVAKYLNDYVDGSLEVMVATHPHPDHIGGLIRVLEEFEVSEIWLNGDTFPRGTRSFKIFERFTSLVKAEGASVHEARRGQTIDIGILSFHVFHPDALLSYDTYQEIPSILHTMNNNSIVLKLRYGNIAFLFTGDAHKEAEANILKARLDIRADILKVGHHGSNGSSSRQFLNSVMPKVAVYMAEGKIRARGPKKPNQSTIAALKKVGAEVYGTNTHGTILITTDGETYTIDTVK